MRRRTTDVRCSAVWVGWALGTLSACASPSFVAVAPGHGTALAAVETFNFDRFGAVNLYRDRGPVRDLVLFVSGDEGWDANAASLARRLAEKGAVVVGIDARHYRDELNKTQEACVSPSADFETLSHYVQSKLSFKKYLQPTLVGYAGGGTWVYVTFAEAPEGLFKSAVSVGFCPEFDLHKPVCGNPGLGVGARFDAAGALQSATLSPARQLPGKWLVLQGARDASCPVDSVKAFAANIPSTQFTALPNVGHDYPIDAGWMPQFDAAYARAAAAHPDVKGGTLPSQVADLPLVVLPAAAGVEDGAGGANGTWFGIFLSGDGGWVAIDKGISTELTKHGIPVVGWDSLKYFWSKRTPDGAAHDLDRVVRHYAKAWGRSHVLLIGYSQGADTLPFMVNRLPPATHAMVGYTTLLGISDNAVFEFHVANWLGTPAKGIPTAPELDRWSGSPYLCMYGESDGDAACEQLTGHDGSLLKLSGGHHFGGGYAAIGDDILARMPKP